MNVQEVRQKYPQYSDLSDRELLTRLHGKYYSDMPLPDFFKSVGFSEARPTEESSLARSALSMAGNTLAGAVRGAGSIGATLLYPIDKATDLIKGDRGDGTGRNAERRQAMTSALGSMGADTDSLSFGLGKIGGEIAGTAGIGGLLAKGITAAGSAVPQIAPYVPKLATALETGGFRTLPPSFVGPAPAATIAGKVGDMTLRTAAGGIVGGASAGLVDPEQAGTGAMIGAAIPGGVKAAGVVGRGIKDLTGSVVKNVLGTTTGVGGNALSVAMQAGKNGDDAFLQNMRGKADMTDVLSDAKAALGRMRIARGDEYRKGMSGVSSDKTVLDLTPVKDAVNKVKSMGTFKGQVIKKNAAGTVDEIAQQVDEWAKLNPGEFHTPEGLDALKQAIGDIRDATNFGTPARKAADSVYHAIKDQINKQAPTYAKTMKDYSDASDLISEIERSLVGGNKTSVDTAMRKLQSLMRNNVNTNYGNRLNLARELEQQGGASLLPSLAGQAMSSITPRGLQGAVASMTGLGGLTVNPAFLATLPLQSPRLIGEAAYASGRLSGKAGDLVGGLLSNPAIANNQGLLGPSTYLPLMTVAPSVAMSR